MNAKRVALVVVAGIAGVIAVASIGFAVTFPKVGPARDHKVDATPALVSRGEYLALHVTVCVDCHSERDWSKYAGPIAPGSWGKGGEHFDRTMGFPGDFYAANITPKGIGRYTDGELERVITTGVTKEGRAIFPVMPYPRYAGLCQDDVDALIAYVRTLAPVDNTPGPTVLDFPMSLIVKTIPKEVPRPPCPDAANQLARGTYLVNAAACAECHTQFDKGKFLPGMELAGGRAFPMPNGTIVSANLTPDVNTGIGAWTEDQFVARIRAHGSKIEDAVSLKPTDMQTFMPWQMYAGMTDDDLKAVFAYLKTVPPKANMVTKWIPRAG